MGGFYGPPGRSGPGAGGSGIGAALAFASPPGVIDPAIVGFTSGIGRLKTTLSANTSWEGLPAGADAQQLLVIIVAGNFTLTLLHLNGGTAQKQILASGDFNITLGDSIGLVYDVGLGQWILQV